MKLKFTLFAIIVSIASLAKSQTVVFQSDFENWTSGMPPGWGGSLTTLSPDSLVPSTINPFNGTASCKFINNELSTKTLSSLPFNIKKGSFYNLSIAAKGQVGPFIIGISNGTSSIPLTFEPVLNSIDSASWTVFSCNFYADSAINNAELRIFFRKKLDTDINFYIDDVKLIEHENFSLVLDTNNIAARVYPNGSLFWDVLFSDIMGFEVPKGGNSHTIFASNLWIGGKNNNNLHLAALRYGQIGKEFQAGPIANNYTSSQYQNKYNRVWKVNKSTIDYHIANWNSSGYVIPSSLADWPGNGNINNGEALKLAPFADLNNNLIYEPHLGEYPLIRGDQAIYIMYNDDLIHGETGGERLKVEIHAMLYSFNNSTIPQINNTVFLTYAIINRSQNTYTDLMVSSFTDFDIGYAYDDYIGCDSVLNFFYGYNGFIDDPDYGDFPPAQGVVFLNHPMKYFMKFNNIGGITHPFTTDPTTAIEYFNYMNGKWRDGSPLMYGFDGITGNSPSNFIYNGMPETNSGWNEVSLNNPPHDRRGLGSIGPFTFSPGQSICVELALPFAQSTTTGNLAPVALLRQNVPLVKSFFDSKNYDCISLTNINKNPNNLGQFDIFPNPATDKIYFSLSDNSKITLIEIVDIHGRKVKSFYSDFEKDYMDINDLKAGIYIIRIKTTNNYYLKKFIKL